MPRTDLLLPDDKPLSDWGYHLSDGHSYRLYESLGHTLLMAAPTNMDNTPDMNCAFWLGVEHMADDEHLEAFSQEVARILGTSPQIVVDAIKD